MQFDLILNNVAKFIDLTDEEIKTFTGHLESKSVKRKAFLLSEGDVCKYSAFVISGCLRGYTVDKSGINNSVFVI